jgi:hypothetical protein
MLTIRNIDKIANTHIIGTEYFIWRVSTALPRQYQMVIKSDIYNHYMRLILSRVLEHNLIGEFYTLQLIDDTIGPNVVSPPFTYPSYGFSSKDMQTPNDFMKSIEKYFKHLIDENYLKT